MWDDLRRDAARPESKAIGIESTQLVANGGHMVNESQFLEGVNGGNGGRLHVQMREGKQASPPPILDDSLNFRCPHQVRRAIGSRLLDRNVIIWASNLVLGAVLALRKAFIASDVSLLARLTALARLGVATDKS